MIPPQARPGFRSRLLSGWLLLWTVGAWGHPLDQWHTRREPGLSGSLNAVCHDGGLFVAVGMGGVILTSTTGEQWDPQDSGTSASLFSIASGNGVLVAGGAAGTILTSPDGTNWTAQSSGVGTFFHELSFGNGWFVAGGSASPSAVLVSQDGASWTPAPPELGVSPNFIVYASGMHFIPSGATNFVIFDGAQWTKRPSGLTRSLYTMGHGGGLFMAIDTGNRAFTSRNAMDWSPCGSPPIVRPSHIVYGHGHFVVGGGSSVMYSTDGAQWGLVLPDFVRSVGFGNGTFVGVGSGEAIAQSDPLIWLRTPGPGTVELFGPVGRVYEIQRTGSLAGGPAWEGMTRLTLTNSPVPWVDPDAPTLPPRFYRAIMDPPPP